MMSTREDAKRHKGKKKEKVKVTNYGRNDYRTKTVFCRNGGYLV